VQLGEALELEALRAGLPEVLVGAPAQLTQQVRWVHMGEISDIAGYVHGGELLLTTGTAIGSRSHDRRRFVREVAEAGVIALVIELGRAFREVPAEMIDEARRHEMVLIALHRDIHWISVTEAVHASIVDHQVHQLRRAEELGREFTSLALDGASAERIVQRLGELIQLGAVLETPMHYVVAASGSVPTSLLEGWPDHARFDHDSADSTAPARVDGRHPCMWQAVRLRHEEVARLHVVSSRAHFDDLVPLAMDRAATALALSMALDRQPSDLVDDARSALLRDIRSRDITSQEEMLARAQTLGAELSGRQLVAVVIRVPSESTFASMDPERNLTILQDVLRQSAARGKASCVSAVDDDRVVAILGVPIGREIREPVRALVGALEHEAIIGPRIGVSRTANPGTLAVALREAEEASRHLGADGTLVYYEDLGITQLLRPLADGPHLARFLDAELGPLLRHDATSSVPLAPTLRAYMASGHNKTDTARRLHLDRSSLYERLDKLGRVLSRDLSDPEQLLRLNVALSALDVVDAAR
jgi:purine catabolism regulator